MNLKLTRQTFQQAAQLSVDMINYFKQREENINNKVLILSLAVSYATLCKGTGVNLHQAMELIMTVYKNTEIVQDE